MKKLTALVALSLIVLLTACGSSSTDAVTFNPLGDYQGRIDGIYSGSGPTDASVTITKADGAYKYEVVFMAEDRGRLSGLSGTCGKTEDKDTKELYCVTPKDVGAYFWVGPISSESWSGSWTYDNYLDESASSSGSFNFARQ